MSFRIVDLTADHLDEYVVCLEDWSDEMKEAGDRKRRWIDRARAEGLRVKLASDEHGTIGGMIQYGPIASSFAAGDGLYFVYCIWVHGHGEGRGNFQGHGMGKTLLQAAEDDARARGARGMAAWGLALPIWMRASWFKRQGYETADRDGLRSLVWKPFAPEAAPPRWIRRGKVPRAVPGRVTVTSFRHGWCPAQNLVHERAKRAAAAFDARVVFRTIDTSERWRFVEWGIADALFVDGREVRTGPPPSYEKIHRLIAKRLKKL